MALSSNNKSGLAKNSKINEAREISNIQTTSQEMKHAKLDGGKKDANIDEKIILDLNRTIQFSNQQQALENGEDSIQSIQFKKFPANNQSTRNRASNHNLTEAV